MKNVTKFDAIREREKERGAGVSVEVRDHAKVYADLRECRWIACARVRRPELRSFDNA